MSAVLRFVKHHVARLPPQRSTKVRKREIETKIHINETTAPAIAANYLTAPLHRCNSADLIFKVPV